MKNSDRQSPFHRRSPAHVIMVHVQVILLLLTPCTQAGDILRMNAGGGGTTDPTGGGAAPVTAASINTAAATAQARANANDMLARNTMALQAVGAMQDAARAAAAGVNNLGANPNGPGQLPNVPNANDPGADIQGMIAGGLEINGPPVGANVLSKSQENARAIVNIQQTQQQALLKWKTFNVGNETTVRFDQSAGGADVASWIAFNQVTDPSGNPTQILGSIESQGQVYVINQNGIIFGGTSVVNTGSLVASSLPINDNLVTRGLLNNPDSQFLFSANSQPAGSKGPTPAYTPPSPPASGRIGDVTVQPGARITAPTTAANVGGRVALIGPNVTNEGTISTPDGQTVLAAGMEVGFDAHSTDDPSLRGLDVFVGSVGTYGGSATNRGLIDAPRGSVVITGKTVNQNGFISSTTSAALNGRVDLLARFNAVPNINFDPTVPDFGRPFVFQSGVSTGLVSQGAGAVIQILPEYSSALKVVGTELALKSQVNMLGLGVYLGTGSVVHAPNGDVALSAGIYDLVLTSGLTDETFVAAGGQIYLDQGAAINVAGSTGIASSLEEYILTVTLRASELADSPLQRAGLLRGETVTVDLREHGTRADGTTWVGTPLANLTGYLGIIERNVGQLTTAGGHVTMTSGEAVVVREGAVVDVSGGFLDYAAGEIQTSRLIHKGNLVDIADARADILYEGIFTPATAASDPRWGTSSSSSALFAAATRYEEAYSSGGAGGGLQISSGSMALDGAFLGRTITGPQQLNAAPAHSSFEVDFRSQQVVRFPLEYPYVSLTPPEIEIRTGASALPAADDFALTGAGVPVALRAERKAAAVLSPELTGSQGFGFLTVDNSDGGIRLSPGMTLATPAGGAVTLKGANIDIQGRILSPGGRIQMTAYNVSPFTTAIIAATGPGAVIPGVDLSRGIVTVGADAVISTAGLIIDDRPGSATAAQVAREVRTAAGTYLSTKAGGEIAIDGHVVKVLAGSRLDVGGGFRITDLGEVEYGDAGSLQIKAGRDPLLSSLLGGSLQLDGVLSGLSGARAGSLSLLAPLIQIGGVASVANTLLLTPDFFSRGGFADFTLTGLGVDLGGQNFAPGVLLSPGVNLQPVAQSLSVLVNPQGGAIQVETLLKAEGYRTPVSLHFEAPGVSDFVSNQLVLRGGVSVGAGSVITLDALGSVSLDAQTVEVLGTIIAPGGSISITGADEFPQNAVPVNGLATVYLGPAGRVSTAGKVVLLEDAFGRRVGSVYGGGSVTVSGNIVTAAGSVIDVSGTTGVLDLLPQEAGSADGSVFAAGLTEAAIFPGSGVTAPPVVAVGASVATRIDSNAGSISLYGSEFLFNAATLVGNAGGATAQGGELKVSSGIFLAPDAFDDDKDINLMVAQDISSFAQPVFAAGPVVGQALGGGLASMGYFGANSFQSGGFDSLTLAGNVRFSGPVSVSARASLRVADGGVLGADALTQLAAPYVALGKALANPTRDEELINPFLVTSSLGQQPSYFSPTFGSGRLEVTADHIDVGFLSLNNVGQATLTGRQDIRGHGYFDMAGHLTLVAGQIYPTSASTFTITAYDYVDAAVPMRGSVTIAPSGETPEFPLSGGGRLNVFASTITQGGTLRAPLGSIILGWDGSGTVPLGLVTNVSVPAAQQVTLSAGSLSAVSAIDPVTGAGVTIPYGIVKDGTNWIDPTGFDITSTGAPVKTLRVSGQNVTTDAGAVIDIRGGGELYGYRWVQGNGGTNDILAGSTNFAILPGFDSIYSPFGAFATSGLFADNLGGDPGYVHEGLAIGDRIFLNTNDLVSGGFYTLLPARYALLPGAFLVTPDSVTPVGTLVKPGGAVLTNGYRYNALNPAVTTPIFQQFEIAPQRVVKLRSEFTDFYGSSFLPEAQQRLSLPVSRVPLDAGQAVLSAVANMQLAGTIVAGGFAGGRGGLVDISSPLEIILAAPGAPLQPGKLVLNTSLLSGWNAESLLIGGERTVAGGRTEVNVRTGTLTVDNAGAPLTGQDIILAATGVLTLAPGAEIRQSGVPSAVDAISVTGNGALVRVSGQASPGFERTGVTPSLVPSLNVGSGVSLVGAGLVLDSTNATSLAADAILTASSVSLGSGQISVQLTNPGALQPTTGLVLGGTVLQDLQDTSALSLLSYSSLDFYGTGTLSNTGTLALRAGEIRGFNQAGGTVRVAASAVLMDNGSNGTAVGVVGPVSGLLEVSANTITIGRNTLQVSQYATVDLIATESIIMQESGALHALANLNASTPYFTATTGARQNLLADGVLNLSRPGGVTAGPASPGLGAHLNFQGSSITADSDVYLPSGILTLHATTGNLTIGGRLDAGGTSRSFFDQIRYTDAGQVRLAADAGTITLTAAGTINLAASPQAGDAGMLYVDAPLGSATFDGALLGQAGAGGVGAGIEMDVGSIASFTALTAKFNGGGFNASQSMRVRNGSLTIDGTVNAHSFLLSVDQGSITVNGTINAAGQTGGRIDLIARGDVTLASGALLSVAGQDFNNAGKGGSVTLESGTSSAGFAGTGRVNIETGSTIDLSVASMVAGDVLTPGSSAHQGKFSGKLHIRAPQNVTFNDVLVDPINGTITGASSILVEGYRIYDLTASGGDITLAVQNSIHSNSQAFLGAAGATVANFTNMTSRLLAGNAGLASVFVLAPGAEIVNRTGNLTLGTTTSAASADWNLATFRYGANSVPGVLTLRAAGNLEFYNTLSDGFDPATSGNAVERMWMGTLTALRTTLPVNTQSWSYRFTSGADFGAADFRSVVALNSLAGETGSLLLGKDAGLAASSSAGSNTSPGTEALTRLAINPSNGTNASTTSNRFQVIRTGSGDIEISAARDVQLLNQFATIYSAGTSVANKTLVFTAGDFALPNMTPSATRFPNQGALGAVQQLYAASYSMAGGNVKVAAGRDIAHYTRDAGNLVADSQKQLPNNWLMRRGYVDENGEYGRIRVSAGGTRTITDSSASTSWWIDFSNFFDGVAALGGGNVELRAGRDVQNVSAHAPTNARAASGTPSAQGLLEMGGGDVNIIAGRNVDGGVYYVERGNATVFAAGDVTTNATRSPSLGRFTPTPIIYDELTWLPTTFFLGRGSVDITAGGNALVGPVANTMLMAQGLNNKHWYKTYFSTYSEDSSVSVTSLGGDITFREVGLTANGVAPESVLKLWMKEVLLLSSNSVSSYQPWLRLAETNVEPFTTLSTLRPGTLRANAFAGNVNVVGRMNLSPSPNGTLELLASGAVNGLQPAGVSSSIIPGRDTVVWVSSSINVSDASPLSVPGALSPFAYYQVYYDPQNPNANNSNTARDTGATFLNGLDLIFAESGSTSGIYASLQVKQSLHAAGGLHANDTEPVRISAGGGDISGLTLFTPKAATILAARDISDIAFYIQNLNAADLSIVSSGRDIIAFNANSVLRSAATVTGNQPGFGETTKSGDIQINGPGTLQVLAGRDINLGTGANNSDGTGVGLISLGNGRNPNLPFEGADIILGAGMGRAAIGLGGTAADFTTFINDFATSPGGDRYLQELAAILGVPAVDVNDPALTAEQQRQLAMAVFFLALRDAGRDHNDPDSPDVGTYRRGFEAIDALFPTTSPGSIQTQARDIRTRSGGSISILAPDGGLQLAPTLFGETLAPPGIITEAGGSISIFTNDDVNIGISRIFTLRGGDIVIWSSEGDIAAGSSAKTVQSAPPTRVLIDPQSAAVSTDLAGLATGGGIGVLATVAGVAPGNVDLIAPIGAVDAGDAGIRATGNLNIAATIVLNASNIAVGGTSAGTPAAPAVAAPSIGGLAGAAAAGAAATSSSAANPEQQAGGQQQIAEQELPSIISVEVIGYGGGSGDDEERRRNQPGE